MRHIDTNPIKKAISSFAAMSASKRHSHWISAIMVLLRHYVSSTPFLTLLVETKSQVAQRARRANGILKLALATLRLEQVLIRTAPYFLGTCHAPRDFLWAPMPKPSSIHYKIWYDPTIACWTIRSKLEDLDERIWPWSTLGKETSS